MFERHRERFISARAEDSDRAVVDVGILTRGKPTLGITLSSLLLQDTSQLRIHIVDTGESPVVNRDDVTQAMRLAFDREATLLDQLSWLGEAGFADCDCVYKNYLMGLFYAVKKD